MGYNARLAIGSRYGTGPNTSAMAGIPFSGSRPGPNLDQSWMHRQNFEGRQRGFDRDNALSLARTQTMPAILAANQKQDRFNRVFPWITGQFSGGQQVGQQPRIDAHPLYNVQQEDQLVNNIWAKADRKTQTQDARAANSFAGRGYGTRSPLLLALQGMHAGKALELQTGGEGETRRDIREKNRNFLLAGQQAQEAQFANRQQEQIGRRNALLAALAGIA